MVCARTGGVGGGGWHGEEVRGGVWGVGWGVGGGGWGVGGGGWGVGGAVATETK